MRRDFLLWGPLTESPEIEELPLEERREGVFPGGGGGKSVPPGLRAIARRQRQPARSAGRYRRSVGQSAKPHSKTPRKPVREVRKVADDALVSAFFFTVILRPGTLTLLHEQPRKGRRGEDADLCMRAKRLGYRPIFSPAPTIVHHGGASEPVKADKIVRLLSAKTTLLRRHWNPMRATVGLGLLKLMVFNRFFFGRLLTILGIRRIRVPGDTWATVWRRRPEWIGAGKSQPSALGRECSG